MHRATGLPELVGAARPRSTYFSSLDRRRSASGFPPVWHVAQYCSAESATDSSWIISPQTGHFSPVLPCTARPDFFSFFSSDAASPADRSTAERSVPTITSCRAATSAALRLDASRNGDILAACKTSSE